MFILDYECIKNHYIVFAVDLSRPKELDADPKAIQQTKFVGQLKNPTNAMVAGESMFVLTILKNIKKKQTKILSRKCNSLIRYGKL